MDGEGNFTGDLCLLIQLAYTLSNGDQEKLRISMHLVPAGEMKCIINLFAVNISYSLEKRCEDTFHRAYCKRVQTMNVVPMTLFIVSTYICTLHYSFSFVSGFDDIAAKSG